MPISISTLSDPFRWNKDGCKEAPGVEEKPELRIPQARLLQALMPADTSDPIFEWPLITRATLAIRAGYTPISGSVTRALNGIYPGSSSGDPHLGVIALEYVEIVKIDVEGISEINYRITPNGIEAFQKFIANGGKIPAVRNASKCTNDRYRKRGDR